MMYFLIVAELFVILCLFGFIIKVRRENSVLREDIQWIWSRVRLKVFTERAGGVVRQEPRAKQDGLIVRRGG